MVMLNEFSIIPEFNRVFHEFHVDSQVIQELAKHDTTNQMQIFKAVREIFQDELLFLIMVSHSPNNIVS